MLMREQWRAKGPKHHNENPGPTPLPGKTRTIFQLWAPTSNGSSTFEVKLQKNGGGGAAPAGGARGGEGGGGGGGGGGYGLVLGLGCRVNGQVEC